MILRVNFAVIFDKMSSGGLEVSFNIVKLLRTLKYSFSISLHDVCKYWNRIRNGDSRYITKYDLMTN